MRLNEFPLGASLSQSLDRLKAMSAGQLDAWLRTLLTPITLQGSPGQQLPSLAALPLTAQADLLLLVRSAQHRFSTSQLAALLAAFEQVAASSSAQNALKASLLDSLATEVHGDNGISWLLGVMPPAPPIPPCPAFLYSANPCFPWAPVLVDAAAAAALNKQQQQRQQQAAAEAAAAEEQSQEALAGEKRLAGEAGGGLGCSSTKRPRLAAGAKQPSAPEEAAAEDQLEAAIAAIRDLVKSSSSSGSGGGATPTALSPAAKEALEIVLAQVAAGSTSALHQSGLDSLQDDSLLLLLLSEAVAAGASFARSAAVAAGLLLPRLRALESPASRDLAAAVEHIGCCNPQAYIAACLQPLLSSPGLGKHAAELIGRTLKASLPLQLLPEVLAAACCASPAGHSSLALSQRTAQQTATSAAGIAWNEQTIAVLQAVVNAKPAMSEAGVVQLAAAFQSAACGSAELAGSAKFARLALSVVKAYPQQAAAAKQQLQATAQACRSFVAKPLAAAVDKL